MLQNWIHSTLDLIFPRTCLHCQNSLLLNEKHLCFDCETLLPFTNFFTYNDNPVSDSFKGKIKFEKSASLYYFYQDGVIQSLLHELKYKQNKEVGLWLGNKIGNEIKKTNWINESTILIPIPIHPKKKKIRGYNQAEVIAQGISEVITIPLNTHWLTKLMMNESQTKKGRIERWLNVKEIFKVEPDILSTKHNILLVDDVITTGATLESCANAILSVNCNVKISIVSVAYTA